jgi:phosphinothricin acetyltransferase
MVADPEVRRARNTDAAGIAAVYTESILARDSTMDTEPFSDADVLTLLTGLGPREALFVLEADARIAGWGIVKKYSDRPGYRIACETSVYLFRSVLRRGWGRRIQHALFRFAEASGYHHVVAKIWAGNRASIAFHEACGFEMVGIQKEVGLVDGTFRDVAIMQKLLPSHAEAELTNGG